MKTINQIIATDNRALIAAAIMQLGAAYTRLVTTEKCPIPAKPWARIGDQFFIYTAHRQVADELQVIASAGNIETFDL